jgi:hypothetical protein
MVPALDPAPRVHAPTRCRKDILPGELPSGIRILPVESIRQPHFAPAGRQILPMDSTHVVDLRPQRFLQAVRKHRATIFRSFPFPDDEQPRGEIDILHPEPQRFEKSQAATIQN